MKVPWNIETVHLTATKHFALKYMKLWGWDFHDLRDGIRDAYKIERMGKTKFEIYVLRGGFKKIITVYYEHYERLVCITGSEGGARK